MADGTVAPRVVAVDADRVRPLRHAVLRAGRPPEESVYPQDGLPDTLHLAVLDDDGSVLVCATFFPEPYEGRDAWRLRGMASDPRVRGRGFAGALLAEALDLLRRRGVALVWCNARTSALPFYRRFGFATVGQEFEVVDVPHYVAVLALTQETNGTST